MSHYSHHIFFCQNERPEGAPRPSCGRCGAGDLQAYAKHRIRDAGLAGPGKVRVNKAGCMERCEEGPVLVIYPEAVWYTYFDQGDIDEIIDRHVVGGEIVERLRLVDAS